jgi:hypothetical protein
MFTYVSIIKTCFHICSAHLVFLFFESHNLVLFFVWKLNLNISFNLCSYEFFYPWHDQTTNLDPIINLPTCLVLFCLLVQSLWCLHIPLTLPSIIWIMSLKSLLCEKRRKYYKSLNVYSCWKISTTSCSKSNSTSWSSYPIISSISFWMRIDISSLKKKGIKLP